MRFDFITNFAKCAVLQHPERRFYGIYNRQCHSPSELHRRTNISGSPFRISSYFVISSKRYSSKSANSNMRLLAWYLGMLESRPILTKSISSAIIYAAADVTSQTITMEPHDAWDPIRTLRMAGFGLMILGPSQHFWFNFVGRVVPKRDVISTFKKLTMGQLFYGPTINGIFFSFNAALQGENGNEIVARLKRDLIPTLLNGLLYWPMCDFFTYKIIPVHLQPLMNSSFAFLWTIYLTYMASLQKAIPE
ncbi:uncharacterized protein LOC142547436 [Primulina tabacum]|uniref:uncharacterized protein LOC142547436 n=1 Tax=Primulina tabacum TaxID=48773 RepID=UPI003F5AC7E9